MRDLRNLKVWKRAHEVALLSYQITADFPKDEIFGLRHSMRKSATDIPSFIAEGCGKPNDSEFARSIAAAVAVTFRLEYQALMARDLTFINSETHDSFAAELVEVRKMLSGFNRRLG
ncbi:MAG: four helix bundle protein [Acidobacteriota bacterium]